MKRNGKNKKGEPSVKRTVAGKKNSEISALEKRIEENLGRKVRITAKNNKGKIELEFYSEDDLNQLADFLCEETL